MIEKIKEFWFDYTNKNFEGRLETVLIVIFFMVPILAIAVLVWVLALHAPMVLLMIVGLISSPFVIAALTGRRKSRSLKKDQ